MSKILKIINIVLLIILIPILILALIFIGKSYIDPDNVPSVFGYTPLVVLSGSMETEIYTGDLVIVKDVETSKLKEGDVIAFYTDDTKEQIITHRIVEITEEDGNLKFITKGDNNMGNDINSVDAKLVVGKYQDVRFAGLGNTVIFLQTPLGMCIIICIPLGILIISQYIQSRQNKKELEELRKQKARNIQDETPQDKE